MIKKIIKIIFNGLTVLQWYCLKYIGGAVLIDKDGKQIHLQAPTGKHFETKRLRNIHQERSRG